MLTVGAAEEPLARRTRNRGSGGWKVGGQRSPGGSHDDLAMDAFVGCSAGHFLFAVSSDPALTLGIGWSRNVSEMLKKCPRHSCGRRPSAFLKARVTTPSSKSRRKIRTVLAQLGGGPALSVLEHFEAQVESLVTRCGSA